MKIPSIENPVRYVGLYAVDFGQSASVGFTAEEVAELLESERFAHIKVYKIHRAYPDGKMELKGVPNGRFSLEAGMFFYAEDSGQAKEDFAGLAALAVQSPPPCMAKAQRARLADGKNLCCIIYPAEHDDDISRWLLDADFRTAGPTEGGVSAVESYYKSEKEILESRHFFAADSFDRLTGELLLAATGRTAVR